MIVNFIMTLRDPIGLLTKHPFAIHGHPFSPMGIQIKHRFFFFLVTFLVAGSEF